MTTAQTEPRRGLSDEQHALLLELYGDDAEGLVKWLSTWAVISPKRAPGLPDQALVVGDWTGEVASRQEREALAYREGRRRLRALHTTLARLRELRDDLMRAWRAYSKSSARNDPDFPAKSRAYRAARDASLAAL